MSTGTRDLISVKSLSSFISENHSVMSEGIEDD